MQTLFEHKKYVVVLGLGATGLSCARYLVSQGIDFVVIDSRPAPSGQHRLQRIAPNATLYSGAWHSDIIAKADLIIASPGVDINQAEIADYVQADAELIGDVELYCRINRSPKLAVTGSNGKSTVVSLLDHIAKHLHIDSVLAGNIGVPVLDVIEQDCDMVILELSSFQLETMTSLNAVAGTVLNISDDHLDRHKTMDNYQAIKHRIYQQSQRRVYNRHQSNTYPTELRVDDISFGIDAPAHGHLGIIKDEQHCYLAFGEQRLINCDQLPLAGQHNYLNCLAALALGYCAGWSMTMMARALLSFEGLAHRCKQVDSGDDIIWINDSKATNIGATLAAIEGLVHPRRRLILIAGGDGKGADFSELQPGISMVDELITLGKDGPEIAQLKANSIEVHSLEQAVQQARNIAEPGDMVLLSPACASIDMFNNYMQRGDMFIAAIRGEQ
ncbi:UDP-N-acetylmuramoyl-L-alanine--D-glutamate ligase [Thalassotalea maritima]|uniref:UDP-N-acetylmuramoyl-L-alanine--D-glutamate ligase n=1 Tax=Thalassotalea maritima TaxID=3242416 RepID=UPI003527F37B